MSKYYCRECGAWPLKARGLCQVCYDRDRYKRNRTKRLSQMKAWRERNPDYMREWNKKMWQLEKETKLKYREAA